MKYGPVKSRADCKKKKSFVSLEDALAKAIYSEETNGLKLNPYKCPHCPRWHLATQKENKMPKFKVTVDCTYRKELTIYAEDDGEAKEKAEAIVRKWNNVHDCAAVEAEEIE